MKITTFRIMSSLGVLSALTQTSILLNIESLPWWLMPLMFITSSIAFLLLAMLIKIFTGKEDHVMLRNFILVMAANYFVIRFFGQPALPSLDMLAVGYGTIIFFGRFGCYNTGCCHGRPNAFGVRYTHEHVKNGFPEYYSTIRLFPVQLVEAFGMLLIITGSIFSMFYFHPGTALSIFISSYCLLRFTLELFRGDPERHFFLSFSEAQWTTVLLSAFVTFEEWRGRLPISQWQNIAFGTLAIVFLVIGITRMIYPEFRVSEPLHVEEIMHVGLSQPDGPVKITVTSLGINISATRTAEGIDYVLSSKRIKMKKRLAQKIATILSFRNQKNSTTAVETRAGVFIVHVCTG